MAKSKAEADVQPHAAASLWLTGRIVVGIDGSEHSVEALRHAVQLAYMGGASLQAVAAWQSPTLYTPALGIGDWSPHNDARDQMQKTIASVFGDDIPETFTATVLEGNPARVLIEASRNADLLVVGSRGHGGFAGLLLGSVSSECAEHADCPVLVVHRRPS